MSHRASTADPGHGLVDGRPPTAALARIVAVIAAAALAAGCALPANNTGMRPATLSPTLAPMVFKEEGTLVLLTAGVNATRFHSKDPFIPIEVWVANKGVSPYMSLDRESFYLMDTFGRRYGMAGVEEVRRLQSGTSLDRQMSQGEFTAAKFNAYHHVTSSFFPGLGTAALILNDHVELPKYGFMADMLYFPRPEGELNGGIFELHLTAKQLPEDVFVVFEVPVEH